MGNETSLTMDDIRALADPEVSQFSKPEISKLYMRFQQLDKTRRGFLTMKDMESMHELCLNQLWKPLLKSIVVDIDNKDEINLKILCGLYGYYLKNHHNN